MYILKPLSKLNFGIFKMLTGSVSWLTQPLVGAAQVVMVKWVSAVCQAAPGTAGRLVVQSWPHRPEQFMIFS